jgi:hypothetical protein
MPIKVIFITYRDDFSASCMEAGSTNFKAE